MMVEAAETSLLGNNGLKAPAAHSGFLVSQPQVSRSPEASGVIRVTAVGGALAPVYVHMGCVVVS